MDSSRLQSEFLNNFIDLMLNPKGLNFENAFTKSKIHLVDNLKVRVIHIDDLLLSKKEVNRPKDLNDIFHLSKLIEEEE